MNGKDSNAKGHDPVVRNDRRRLLRKLNFPYVLLQNIVHNEDDKLLKVVFSPIFHELNGTLFEHRLGHRL